jgi:hypothetical protein
MRWKVEDMGQMIGMEEYIDTLLYPVCVSGAKWDESWIKDQFWLERVCSYVEKQLTGRLFLFQSLCVAQAKEGYEKTACDFIEQNILALTARFPYRLVVTNDVILAETLTKTGVCAYVVSEPPEIKIDTTPFLEKALSESNRIVKSCIALWQSV